MLVTYFDRRYAPQGLAMLQSYYRHHPDEWATVLALDDCTLEGLRFVCRERGGWSPRLVVVPMADLMAETDGLAAALADRDTRERAWTLAAPLCRFAAQNQEHIVEYMDADCYLFSPLDSVRKECAGHAVGIVPHRWDSAHAERLRPAGRYNVGYVYFDARRIEARDVLTDWCADVVAWRSNETGARFSDQVFLDSWPNRKGMHEIMHPGINVAPYNHFEHRYSSDLRDLFIDRAPLVTYHFHEWRGEFLGAGQGMRVHRGGHRIREEIGRTLYEPYEVAVYRCAAAWHGWLQRWAEMRPETPQ